MLFIAYEKCSTCKKALAKLRALGFEPEVRDIKTRPPTEAELRAFHERSRLPLKRFFNSSGIKYRELDLKDRLPGMTDEDMYALLASDGMLVKRPLLVTDDTVLAGYREADYEALAKSRKNT